LRSRGMTTTGYCRSSRPISLNSVPAESQGTCAAARDKQKARARRQKRNRHAT
jgi:hypothetical protein